MRRLGYSPALDGIRGIAIVAVLVVHATYIMVPSVSTKVLPGGFLGVDLFFVLSGFLITALLLGEQHETGRVSLRAFYARRALRLLPALVVVMAAAWVYALAAHLSLAVQGHTTAYVGLYVTNWFQAAGKPIAYGLGQMWSLAVEEQFYLLWPLLTVAVLTFARSRRVVIPVLVVSIVAVALHRALLWRGGVSWDVLYIRTDTRADSLLVGALLAHLWVRNLLPSGPLLRAAGTVSLAGLLVVMATVERDSGLLYSGGLTAVAVAAAVVIAAALDDAWIGTRLLRTAPLRVLGTVSYGVYLWHALVFTAVARAGAGWPAVAKVVVGMAATGAAAAASWQFVERPFLARKRRWDRRERRQAEDVHTAPPPVTLVLTPDGVVVPAPVAG